MKENSERIESFVSEKRVKLHIFKNSGRKIWTVVGKSKEHWLDPELEFCSCDGFYFGNIAEKKQCYHLHSLALAIKENKFETITFSDDEYENFLSGLIADL